MKENGYVTAFWMILIGAAIILVLQLIGASLIAILMLVYRYIKKKIRKNNTK